jgi:hypothetical protein
MKHPVCPRCEYLGSSADSTDECALYYCPGPHHGRNSVHADGAKLTAARNLYDRWSVYLHERISTTGPYYPIRKAAALAVEAGKISKTQADWMLS